MYNSDINFGVLAFTRFAIAATGAVLIAFLSFLPLKAQPVAFEVVSVKHNKSGDWKDGVSISPGRLAARNMSLNQLVKAAYGLEDYQLSAGRGWLESDKYDIEGKADGPARGEQLKQMLQALLADRFQLKFHRETKNLQVYALVIHKGGTKLREVQEADPKPQRPTLDSPSQLLFMRATIPQLAAIFSRPLERPVVDRTGLKGLYDISLTIDATDDFFTVVSEKLGLTLRPEEAPIQTVIIDHAERPVSD